MFNFFKKKTICRHIWSVQTATKNGTQAEDSPYDPCLMQKWIVKEKCVKCGKEHFDKRITHLGEELLDENYYETI